MESVQQAAAEIGREQLPSVNSMVFLVKGLRVTSDVCHSWSL